MNEQVKLLLKEIKLKEDYYPLFTTSEIKEINHFEKSDHYQFIIEIDDFLPIDVYDFFFENINTCFQDAEKVTIEFIVRNNKMEEINNYFSYVLQKVFVNSPFVQLYNDCELFVEDNVLKILVANAAEKQKIEANKKKIINTINQLGFVFTKIKVEVDINKQTSVIIEEKPIVIEKEKKPSHIIFGSEIRGKSKALDEIIGEESSVIVEGLVYDIDFFETKKNNLKIITLKLTDYSNSIFAKLFVNDNKVYFDLKKQLEANQWYKIRGFTKNDSFAKEMVLNVRDINVSNKKANVVTDDSEEKRVELHCHTFMSQMDGMISPSNLIKFAKKLGHEAVAITDHNSLQSFPDIYREVKDDESFKAIFGCELIMINDDIKIINKTDERSLLETVYVVFDVETTGFNAGADDQIIEIGAVKIKKGKIIDSFSKLINPQKPLPAKIIEITKITDEMLKDEKSEEEVVREFITWAGDAPLVAHNAKFDLSFLERAFSLYELGELNNTVIDTLELSRALESNQAKHSLAALVKRYEIPFDDNQHHRAEYDATATALIFDKMVRKLVGQNYEKISDLDNIISKEDIFKFGQSFHINILAQNAIGLKNLFKLVSYANTDYFYKTPRIPRSKLEQLREGLLIGSGCYLSEVFVEARSKTEEELRNIMVFYDYIEIQPPELYDHLIQGGDFADQKELLMLLKKIIDVAKAAGVMVVATGDVHHLTRDDKIYREIIINQKVPGGGLHPLARKQITKIPSAHFRTTGEMLDSFAFLDEKIAYQIVIENTNKIKDLIEKYPVIIDTNGVPFSPKIENSEEIVKDLVYQSAKEKYGDPLPEIVKERIESELHGIIGGGFDVIYLISHKLVKKSNEDGYLVGSRGSVGSSLVATLMDITEVNPLPPHYLCPNCQLSIFEEDGETLGSIYSSGYDLPNRQCPNCQFELLKDGQDMPFATFLGFNADKVPDIDLNFSGEYQAKAHEYVKELFGEQRVLRAGTIGTVAKKTAYGFVRGYMEDKNVNLRLAEVDRLTLGCTGVKRTTGQHPGGIIVVPEYKEVFDFTPYQYPADDIKSAWRTSHFDYHAIDENLLKLDILGHDDPTVLKMLGDLTKIDVTKINPTDEKVMQIFSSPTVLGVTTDQILCETGTLGVPEFGTKFVISMLVDTKPKTFGELTKISGLSHGTDVWLGNAQELIRNNICDFKEVIGCRDDIMVYLMYNGLDTKDAFQIMEFVRKGKASKEPEKWQEFEKKMYEKNIPSWYIEACHQIKYMFPKAHAAAYVLSALRIAWFKVHKPIYYYASYFSVRCYDFNIDAMINGYATTKNLVVDLLNKGYEITNKEMAILEDMHLALEALARGIKFTPIDLDKSDAMNFLVLDDNTLLPPFRAIEGLGDQVAKKIVSEREKKPFLSIEDLQKRGKVNSTTIDKMRIMGMLDHLDESSQLSLF